MIRTAMLSFWHVHAKDYAREAEAHPGIKLVAVWDEEPERGRREAESRGLLFFEHMEELLGRPDVDAVIVDTPTSMHKEVMVAAARAGKHIFTEKVLAATWQDCREILSAVQEAGVKLTVSLPRLNHGYTLAVQEVLRQGLLGDITLVRTRLSHDGALPREGSPGGWLPSHFYSLEQCRGGALIDLGCHPMYLARLFLGMPESVTASFGYMTGREVEDHAAVLLRYSSGALAVVEAGFVNAHSPFVIEVHGTSGSLLYSDHDRQMLLRSSLDSGEASSSWRALELPSDQPTALEQWAAHIEQGTEGRTNVELAGDLTRLMEASYRSAHSGTIVRIPDIES